MFCPHCGAELGEGERFCPQCGAERKSPPDPEGTQEKEHAKFGIVGNGSSDGLEHAKFGIVGGGTGGRRRPPERSWVRTLLLIASGLLAVTALVLTGLLLLGGEKVPKPEEIHATLQAISKAAAPYQDENGDVPPEQVQAALNAVYTTAKNDPNVSSCRQDPYAVVIHIPSRPTYVYCPTAGGLEPPAASQQTAPVIPGYDPPVSVGPTLGEQDLQLQILSVQPYATENREIAERNGYNHDLLAPDLVARDLAARDPCRSSASPESFEISMDSRVHLLRSSRHRSLSASSDPPPPEEI